jgi:hypothetical protein
MEPFLFLVYLVCFVYTIFYTIALYQTQGLYGINLLLIFIIIPLLGAITYLYFRRKDE